MMLDPAGDHGYYVVAWRCQQFDETGLTSGETECSLIQRRINLQSLWFSDISVLGISGENSKASRT